MKTLFSLFLAVLLVGCSNGKQGKQNSNVIAERVAVGKDSVVRVVVSNVKDTVTINLSELITDVEIVPLENINEAYTSVSLTYLSDSYIGMAGGTENPFKLFDRKTGKFIANLGNVGRGPNEYFAVYSAQIDEPNNRAYLLPWNQSQILVFDLAGNALEPIPTPYGMPKGQFKVDAAKGAITISIVPFKGGAKSVVWQQDFKGNILNEVSAEPLALQPDFSNEVSLGNNTDAFDFSLLTWDGKPDSLYHYVDGRLKPVFTLDFELSTDKQQFGQAPIHTFIELPTIYIASVSFPKQVGENSYTTTEPQLLYVDKATLRGGWMRLENDILGTGTMIYASFSGGYFIENLEPIGLLEQVDKALEKGGLSDQVTERLMKIKSVAKEDGNNIVIIGKLK